MKRNIWLKKCIMDEISKKRYVEIKRKELEDKIIIVY